MAIKLSSIHPNPNNPRIIKDAKFKQLVKSIKDFPKMMELRPIVVDDSGMIVGGTQRYRALKELGYKEVPDEWVKRAKDFTPAELQEFMVKDNVSAGEWDFDILANEWETEDLVNWGLDIPGVSSDSIKPKEVELKPYKQTHILLSFPPDKLADIQHLLQQITAFSFVEYEQSNN